MCSPPKLSYYPRTPVQLTSFPRVSVSPSVSVPPTNAAPPDAEADLKPIESKHIQPVTERKQFTIAKQQNDQCKQISLIHNKLL